MQPLAFIASSAEEAVSQIRTALGPNAVVLNVRPLPANGIARLWQKPMIEVLAHVPETPTQAAPVPEAVAAFRQQVAHAEEQGKAQDDLTLLREADAKSAASVADEDAEVRSGHWHVGAILQRTGLSALHAQGIVDQLRAQHGDNPPSLNEEIRLARQCLSARWRKPRPLATGSLHVLVGPAGSGKTTCLCKWLTQSALVEGRLARVWRLDGATANMAESLSVYCDILGVPNERAWETTPGAFAEDIGFIDLPGIDWKNPIAVKELGGQLKKFGQPHIHLVLNGAYDPAILLTQIRAFAEIPVEDLIISHLDEVTKWGKIWNLVLGTNYSIRHFSTGQNIPGDFSEASAESLLDRQLPCK